MEPYSIELHPIALCLSESEYKRHRRMDTNGDDGLSRVKAERITVGAASDGGKTTSVDSGMETGNDSNDSAVAQTDINNIDWADATKKWFDSEVNKKNQLAMTKTLSQLGAPAAQSAAPKFTAIDIDQPQSSLSADAMDDTSAFLERGFIVTAMPAVFEHHLEPIDQDYKDRKLRVANVGHLRALRRSAMDGRNSVKCRKERRMRFAAATNNVEVVKSILESGISPNNSDEHGGTPLHFASGGGYTEIVALLLNYGADVKRRDCIGNTPLHLAVFMSKISVVTLLLEAGTDPLSTGYQGYSPLKLANTKLRLLKNCKGDEMIAVKSTVCDIVNMLSAYLKNRNGFNDQVEALSSFYSRLSLSNTSDEVKNEVENLLSNIDYLQLLTNIDYLQLTNRS